MASILLKEIPIEVQDIILDEQAKVRKKTKRVVSQQRIIYRIIRSFGKKAEAAG